MKTLALRSGNAMPALGLGTSQLRGSACVDAVLMAIEMGYRHLDTADMYGNHEAVGEAMRISGVARDEMFLTTKVPPDSLAAEDVAASIERYLGELKTDYIDMLLIHWPNSEIPVGETLGAMNAFKDRGKVRSIGVSNFTSRHLDEAESSGVLVENDQVEIHPTFNQKRLQEFCDDAGIVLTAYAPLGRGKDLHVSIVEDLAEKYGVSVPQVTLNWLVSRGIAVIPKASSREHLADNLASIEWEMEPADAERMWQVPQGSRIFSPGFAEFDE